MARYQSTLTGPEMDAALLDMAEHNSEAYAVGTRAGEPVTEGDATFENNAKHYAESAEDSAAYAERVIQGTVTQAVRWDVAQSLGGVAEERARMNIGITDYLTVRNNAATGYNHSSKTNNPHQVDYSQVGADPAGTAAYEASSKVTQFLARNTTVNAADTNYTNYMARGTILSSTEVNPTVNGTIAWVYE